MPRGTHGAGYEPHAGDSQGVPAMLMLVTSHVVGQGGRERVFAHVAAEWQRLNGRVALALLDHADHAAWERSVASRVYVAGIDPAGAVRRRAGAIVRYVASVLRDFRPDVVFVTEPLGAPIVRLAALFAHQPAPSVLSWLHVDPRYARHLWALRWCDGHLALCAGLGRELAVPADRVFVVYNPIDVTGAALCPRPDIKDPIELVFIGRLHHQKRVDRILRSLALVHSARWRLHVVGDGPDRAELHSMARSLRIESRVVWYGWMEDPWSSLRSASAFLMSSDMEGFPIVLLEAVAHGLPIIAMDCPYGPSEIVIPGRNGWLVPHGDEAAMAGVVEGLCGRELVLPTLESVRATATRFDARAVVGHMIAVSQRYARRSATPG